MNPVLHAPSRIAQQGGDLGTGHSLGNEEHAMESVVVARLVRTTNLILQPQNDAGGIGDLERLHATI
jgi:hypothetical protein